jgi:FkbM family methyltransferase
MTMAGAGVAGAPMRPRLSWLRPRRARELLFWQILYPLRGDRLGGAGPDPRVALDFAPDVVLELTRSDAGHIAIRYCGFVEFSLTRRILQLAAAGGTLVDVGANYGYFTCLWAALRNTNRAIAFEPAPTAFAVLEANVASNGLQDRVTLFRAAVGKSASIGRFIEAPQGQSGLSHLLPDGELNGSDVPVEVVTLDDFFAAAGRAPTNIDVLKVDAEGADALVLAGGENLLRGKRIKTLFFEHDEKLNRRFGIGPREPQRLLQDCGYDVRRIGRFVWCASASERGTADL